MKLQDYLDKRYQVSTAKLYAFEICHYLDRIGGEEVALGTSYGELIGELSRLRSGMRIRQHLVASCTPSRLITATWWRRANE